MADATTAAKLIYTNGGGQAYSQLWEVFTGELLNGTATIDSIINSTVKGFNTEEFGYFGIWIIGTPSSGTANFNVILLESPNDTVANYVAPDADSAIGTVADNNPHVFAIAPAPMPRMRIRVTGIASNPATTAITAYLFMVN